MPNLKVLYLQGNPVVKRIPFYRKFVIGRLRGLTYLDDRPVFDDERQRCDVWMKAYNEGILIDWDIALLILVRNQLLQADRTLRPQPNGTRSCASTPPSAQRRNATSTRLPTSCAVLRLNLRVSRTVVVVRAHTILHRKGLVVSETPKLQRTSMPRAKSSQRVMERAMKERPRKHLMIDCQN